VTWERKGQESLKVACITFNLQTSGNSGEVKIKSLHDATQEMCHNFQMEGVKILKPRRNMACNFISSCLKSTCSVHRIKHEKRDMHMWLHNDVFLLILIAKHVF